MLQKGKTSTCIFSSTIAECLQTYADARSTNAFNAINSSLSDFVKSHFTTFNSQMRNVSLGIHGNIQAKTNTNTFQTLINLSSKEQMAELDWMPMARSESSQNLRHAVILDVLIGLVCNNIWQPYSYYVEDKGSEIQKVLSNISLELQGLCLRKEGAWRNIMMQASGGLKETNYTMLDKLISDFFTKISFIVEERQRLALQEALRSILMTAMDIWSQVQSDGSKIRITQQPDPRDVEGWSWTSVNSPEVIGSQINGHEMPQPAREAKNFVLFPQVTRVRYSDMINGSRLSQDGRSTDARQVTINKGVVLYGDSSVMNRAVEETYKTRQDLHQALERATNGT